MKNIFILIIRFYQKYISPLFPKSCRYYPTCSEYASWQFKFNGITKAFLFTSLRLLKCNQLFPGGIDYPKIKYRFKNLSYRKIDVVFWLVPYKNNKFYIIKAIKGK